MIYNFQEVATGYRRYVNGGERRTCPYMVMATMGKCRQTGEWIEILVAAPLLYI